MTRPILFAGGTGVVGHHAVRIFRERHPAIPVWIGARNMEHATRLAGEIGFAKAVKLDLDAPSLGLPGNETPGAVVMMTPDEGLTGLAYAQDHRIPYLSMGNWLVEIGAELAHFARRPEASPVILASHWHGAPAVFLTQRAMQTLDSVSAVHIGAVIDEQDAVGPAAKADMEKGAANAAGVWAFQNGHRTWLSGHSAQRTFQTLDGREVVGQAFSPYDIASLHALTKAKEIRFDLAVAASSSRLRGGTVATELIVDIQGVAQGRPCQRLITVEYGKGQAALTALGTVLTLSTALGLEGVPALGPGLYFPEHVVSPDVYLEELKKAGATVSNA